MIEAVSITTYEPYNVTHNRTRAECSMIMQVGPPPRAPEPTLPWLLTRRVAWRIKTRARR
jgi:hypothetical protein